MMVLASCSQVEERPLVSIYLHEDPDATLWVQRSAGYRAVAQQTFTMALRRLSPALADKDWSAVTGPPEG